MWQRILFVGGSLFCGRTLLQMGLVAVKGAKRELPAWLFIPGVRAALTLSKESVLCLNRKGRACKLQHKGGPRAACSFPSCSEIKCLIAAFMF